MKLNLGCGDYPIKGYVNIDNRPGVGDLTEDVFVLPSFMPGSVDEIVASHVLEHASYDRISGVLQRWCGLLVPRGTIHIAVPDFGKVLSTFYQKYLDGNITWEYFNSRIFGNSDVAKQMYGPDPADYEVAFHKAVFTKEMLIACLVQAGFTDVRAVRTFPGREVVGKEVCVAGTKF